MRVLARLLRGRLPTFILALSMSAVLLILPGVKTLPIVKAFQGKPAAHAGKLLSLEVPLADPTPEFVYLPLLSLSSIVFQDNFADDGSGWPDREWGDWCNFRYKDGAYQIQSYQPIDSHTICAAKNYSVPSQPNGTFSVRVRRLSGTDSHVLMGIWFGAADNAIDYRWEMMAYPNNSENECDGKKAGFSLAAVVDGHAHEYHFICSSNIGTEDKAWSTLKVIRDGAHIAFFVNDKKQYETSAGNYNLGNGYVLMAMTSLDDDNDEDDPLTVEFDDLIITRDVDFP